MSDIIESMAKAICTAGWIEDAEPCRSLCGLCKVAATRALAAALAHLEKPTPEMIEAGRDSIREWLGDGKDWRTIKESLDDGATVAFTAMIRAAK